MRGSPSTTASPRPALGAGDHRAELEEVEGLAVAPDAPLAEQRGAARPEADGDDRRQQDRAGEDERGRGRDEVEGAPAHRVPSGGAQPAGVPWRRWSQSPAAMLACVRT